MNVQENSRVKILVPLAVALLLAVSVRVLPAAYNFVIGTDEALYLTLAGHLAAGDGFTADGIHPHSEFDPGYPLFAALIYRLTNTIPFSSSITANDVWLLELPARLNILVLGSLLVIPIYFLARAFDRENNFAFRAALLTATVPALALGVPNFEAASEQLYTLALWSGWLFLWLALNKRKWFWFLFSGIAFGLAHLTRYEGLISAGMALVVAIIWLWQERASVSLRGERSLFARSHLRAPLAILSLLGGVLLLAAPYALYQTARTGSVFSTKSIVHQLHGEALASPDPFAWEKSYANYELVRDNPGLYPPLPIYLWEHREQTALNYVRNTFTQLRLALTSPTFLFILWLPLSILGALGDCFVGRGVRATPRNDKRAQNFFLAAALTPALVFPLSVVDGRYLLPLVPAGMLWAARGLTVADSWVAGRFTLHTPLSTKVLSRYLATIALVSLFIAADIAAIFFIPRPIEFRTAGLELRGVLSAQAPVLMRKRQLAFYANVAYESLPFSDLQGVFDYAQKKNAEYFELDARTTPSTRPQLVYLLTAPAPPTTEIFYNKNLVIVYRILK